MRFKLIIDRFTSRDFTPPASERLEEDFASLEDAQIEMDLWRSGWIKQGYCLAPSGYYEKVSLRRDVFIVDEQNPGERIR